MAPPRPIGVIVTMAENETHVLDAWPVTHVKLERKAFHDGRIPAAIARGLGESVCHTLAALSERSV